MAHRIVRIEKINWTICSHAMVSDSLSTIFEVLSFYGIYCVKKSIGSDL